MAGLLQPRPGSSCTLLSQQPGAGRLYQCCSSHSGRGSGIQFLPTAWFGHHHFNLEEASPCSHAVEPPKARVKSAARFSCGAGLLRQANRLRADAPGSGSGEVVGCVPARRDDDREHGIAAASVILSCVPKRDLTMGRAVDAKACAMQCDSLFLTMQLTDCLPPPPPWT